MIVNEFHHEFSVSSSPTALSPTDLGRLSIRWLLRFSPHPSTQDPQPFFSPFLFSSCSETVRVAISTTTSTKFSRSEMVRTAFLTQQGTGTLLITLISAKLRTWKLELFEYNGGQCIGTVFQGEMSNADHQAVILIKIMLEHFQILIEARRRCSRGWRWAPIEKKACCIYQQRCGQGSQTLTGKQLYWLNFCQNTSKPLLKRDAVALSNKDVDWLKHEISDIKECIKDMAEHLGNVEYRLEELCLDWHPRMVLSPSGL